MNVSSQFPQAFVEFISSAEHKASHCGGSWREAAVDFHSRNKTNTMEVDSCFIPACFIMSSNRRKKLKHVWIKWDEEIMTEFNLWMNYPFTFWLWILQMCECQYLPLRHYQIYLNSFCVLCVFAVVNCIMGCGSLLCPFLML